MRCRVVAGHCENCGRPAGQAGQCQPGLGDYVAIAARAAGITESVAESAAKAAGARSCGCGRRRAAANRLGRKYLGIGGKEKLHGLTPVQDKAEPSV